ncbi:PKD domain-containing protein [Shewanella saliphila]|uniref:Lipoprotein n=1 Tax=Shewanella saliphila TaxID=2282698 RepID=A0ABQ2Q861_9GAMM|nr:hypothetical protein [Shewanella saliphila]MCL1102782.1 hypothetical protein [Shewanella saliphila]GGP61320.1 hypothetical protein GCM10009409_28860 [Shewanella saliphila]
MNVPRNISLYSLLASTIVLTACGSDSSDNHSTDIPSSSAFEICSDDSNTSLVSTGSELVFIVEQDYAVNRPGSITASIADQDSAGRTFLWQQISGPTLELASVNSPVLAFTPGSNDNYSFKVTVTGGSNNYEEIVSITADSADNILRVNHDHQMVANTDASLRIQNINGQVPTDISWCMYPNIDNVGFTSVDLTDTNRPLFNAPDVNSDQLISLKATATFDGQTISDDVHLLVTKETATPSNAYFTNPLARVYPYKADSAYADNLVNCTYSNQQVASCNILNELPFISQDSQPDPIDTIMDRVVVSHDWMGKSFETYLRAQTNNDFVELLQSVTAIIISYDIRPSFYSGYIGAIYIDPEYLWLTPAQRDTINETPDYRSNYGEELNYLSPYRYVKDNDYASEYIEKDNRINRTMENMSANFARLMYHELAHANDYYPQSIHATLQGPSLREEFDRRFASDDMTSRQLQMRYPLLSDEMYGLAEVNYAGESANSTQKAYTPSDVAEFFTNDLANDDYAYSSTREDVAMLFEEIMMSHRYGILRDIAITDKPDVQTSSTITVEWGQRGRVGQAELRDRASYVLGQMLPDINTQLVMDGLPEPVALVKGQTWAQNLVLTVDQSKSPQKVSNQSDSAVIDNRPLQFSGDQHAH